MVEEIKYEDALKGFPKIAIYNNYERCCDCIEAWLDFDGSPDANHCPPMQHTYETFESMKKDSAMLDKFSMAIVDSRVVCPFYYPRNQAKYKDYRKLFSFKMDSEEYHIAVRDAGGVFVHCEDPRVKRATLEFIPTPGGYSHSGCTTDTRGTISLDFKFLETKENEASIKIGITDDYEYWYYGSAGDDWHPSSSHYEKLLKLTKDGKAIKVNVLPIEDDTGNNL